MEETITPPRSVYGLLGACRGESCSECGYPETTALLAPIAHGGTWLWRQVAVFCHNCGTSGGDRAAVTEWLGRFPTRRSATWEEGA